MTSCTGHSLRAEDVREIRRLRRRMEVELARERAGRVNIKMDKPIKKRDLFAVFETILRMNNTTIVKGGKINQIVPISAGVKIPIGVYDYSEFVGKGIHAEAAKPSAGTPAGSSWTISPRQMRPS